MITALEQELEPPAEQLRSLLSTSVGEFLFKGSAHKMRLTDFGVDVETRLKDLDHAEYAADEIENFKQVMKVRVAHLVELGLKRFDRLSFDVWHLLATVKPAAVGYTDCYHKRWASRVTAIGLQTGQLKLTAWEILLFKPGGLPNTCASFQLPDDLFFSTA